MENNRYNLKKSRVAAVILIITAGMIFVLAQLYKIQVVESKSFHETAVKQQTGDILISPKRGLIYDRNLNILAGNAPVEQIFISPDDIKSEEEAKLIARGLSEILELDYEAVYAKTQKEKRKDETIKNNVETETADKVRKFKADNGIEAVYFREQTKRVYPFSNLASHVIGFTNTKNEGRFGIEYSCDEYLCGTPGRIITTKNALGRSMGEYTTYISEQNGNNVVLTIDKTVQACLEKNLEEAFRESAPKERVTGIVMDVCTGEILGMATVPSFDLNAPSDIDDETLGFINLDGITLGRIEKEYPDSEEERESEIKKEKLFKLWQNKAISEAYEPGSTMKITTAAIGLEEKAVKETDNFYCAGSYNVSGIDIACHLKGGHGSMTFEQGLQNSCNPITMQTAEKIGARTFLKYFDAFGYNQKTGIDLPWEAGGIMHASENFRTVELATASFGQRFTITPMQLLTGIAAVANGGKIIVPRVVKAVIDSEGNVVKNFEPEIKRVIISEDTSKRVSKILAGGVSGGGAARNAFVKGYEVAAKTGTSEKGVDTEDRIGSCAAYAPAGNPQIAVIIVVDEPTGHSVYGGVIAAPFVAKTLAEILPYLGIEPEYGEEEIEERLITVRNYGMQKAESAKDDIISRGLNYTVIGEGKFVREQVPRAGSMLLRGGMVILYTDSTKEKQTVTVPNVYGMTAKQADKTITGAELNINITGAENMNSSATALRQEPAAGETVQKGTIISVEFRHNSVTD